MHTHMRTYAPTRAPTHYTDTCSKTHLWLSGNLARCETLPCRQRGFMSLWGFNILSGTSLSKLRWRVPTNVKKRRKSNCIQYYHTTHTHTLHDHLGVCMCTDPICIWVYFCMWVCACACIVFVPARVCACIYMHVSARVFVCAGLSTSKQTCQ